MRSGTVHFSLAVLVVTVVLGGQVSAIAVPEWWAEGESKAEQVGDGARVESTVQFRGAEQPDRTGGRDSAGGVTGARNRYSYYWRPAAPPPECPRGHLEWREQVRYDRISDVETVVGPGRCVDRAAEAKLRRIAVLPEIP